ncbi:hypothetical protein DEV92_12347 [Phyllobacterium myrsinacearum]|nr:hypothetical protein DEV92_12347 [Phyllobacterium myrsinacearum]RZU96762.1 hypothetical protein EV654_5196 [Phyllobacterium myrsinacearum]
MGPVACINCQGRHEDRDFPDVSHVSVRTNVRQLTLTPPASPGNMPCLKTILRVPILNWRSGTNGTLKRQLQPRGCCTAREPALQQPGMRLRRAAMVEGPTIGSGLVSLNAFARKPARRLAQMQARQRSFAIIAGRLRSFGSSQHLFPVSELTKRGQTYGFFPSATEWPSVAALCGLSTVMSAHVPINSVTGTSSSRHRA